MIIIEVIKRGGIFFDFKAKKLKLANDFLATKGTNSLKI